MLTFIFCFIGLIFLTLFLLVRNKKGSCLAVIMKAMTSLFFMATAASALLANYEGVTAVSKVLLFMGLLLGLIGDITLDFKVYFKTIAKESNYERASKDSDSMMYIGMICFGIGHICYIASLILRYPGQEISLLYACLGGLALILLVFLVAIKLLKMNFGKFFTPCLCYGFLLATFVILTLVCMLGEFTKEALILFIASVLFIISDLILSMTYFSKESDYEKKGILNPESRFMISANHITYYAAQYLIAIAIMLI